jgi:hypothetical protein
MLIGDSGSSTSRSPPSCFNLAVPSVRRVLPSAFQIYRCTKTGSSPRNVSSVFVSVSVREAGSGLAGDSYSRPLEKGTHETDRTLVNKRVKGVRNVAKLIKALARCEVVEGEMVARRV